MSVKPESNHRNMDGVRNEQAAMDIPIFGRKKESCASVFLRCQCVECCSLDTHVRCFSEQLRSRCDFVWAFLPLSFF